MGFARNSLDAARAVRMTGQPRLLGFGHSHLSALEIAYGPWRSASTAEMPTIEFVQMLDPRFRPVTGTAVADLDAVMAGLGAVCAAGVPDFAFSCFSGNDYHVLSMVQHPEPYDFVLPGRPDLPLSPGAQIIPFQSIEATMKTALRQTIADLARIAGSLPCRLYNIVSPPPIPDNAFLNQAGNAFWSKAEALGIAPAAFRWKVWRLQSLVYEEGLAETGIATVPPPRDAVDADGFMQPAGWHPDGVHGSAWYGTLVLNQLAELMHSDAGAVRNV